MESKKSQSKVSKVTAWKILGWFFGLLFLFAGVIFLAVGRGFVIGIIYLLIGIIILPLTNTFLKKRFNFELSGGAKVLIIVGVFVLFTFVLTQTASKETTTKTSIDSAQSFFSMMNQVESDVQTSIGDPNAQIFLNKKVITNGVIGITLGKYAYYDDESLKDMGHLLMTTWARIDQDQSGVLIIYFYNENGRKIMEATYSSFAGVQVKLI